MKKYIFILMALILSIGAMAQGPWAGFFRPATPEMLAQKRSAGEGLLKTEAGVERYSTWLVRPQVALIAQAFDFSGDKPVVESLNSAGFGLSYGRFETINEKAYCTVSVNLSLLTSVRLNDIESLKLGVAATVDLWDKIIGVGVGWLDGKIMPLTTISFSF